MLIEFSKQVNDTSGIVGGHLIYTFVIQNTQEYKLDAVRIHDKLDASIQFVEGSVMINNVSKPDANIKEGIDLGEVEVDELIYVSFKALIVNNDKSPIVNKGYLDYKYYDEETGDGKVVTQESNVVNVFIYIAKVSCSITADKTEASLGDIIEYSIKLKNTGTIPALDVMFFNELPDSLQFIPESFKLNGHLLEDVDLKNGLYLNSMEINDTFRISYSAKVVGGSHTGFAKNKIYTRFSYRLEYDYYDAIVSDICYHNLRVALSSFQQMIVNEYVCLPPDNPDIEAIDNVLTDVTIDNYYIINTKPSVSFENQHLTHYKLIIHGTINISVIYTGLETEQPIHSINQQFPFSTYIILPPDYVDQDIELSTIVEDTTINQIDDRCLDASVVMLVVARFKE